MTDILALRDQFARLALANYYMTRPRHEDDDELPVAAVVARAALRIFVSEVMKSVTSETKNHGECKKIALEKGKVLFDDVTAQYADVMSEKIHIHFKELQNFQSWKRL